MKNETRNEKRSDFKQRKQAGFVIGGVLVLILITSTADMVSKRENSVVEVIGAWFVISAAALRHRAVTSCHEEVGGVRALFVSSLMLQKCQVLR